MVTMTQTAMTRLMKGILKMGRIMNDD